MSFRVGSRRALSAVLAVFVVATVNFASAPGTSLADESVVSTNAGLTNEETAAVARDADGDTVVVWQTLPDSSGDIYYRLLSYDGTHVAGGKVNTSVAGARANPAVAMDAAGNFAIVWDGLDGSVLGSKDVFVQRFDSSGAKQGGEFRIGTTGTNESRPDVAMSAAGAFVIAYQGLGSSGVDIRAARYSNSGVLQGDVQANVSDTGNSQTRPAVAMAADGSFVIVWESNASDADAGLGVYGQRFDASGAALGAQLHPAVAGTDDQSVPDVAVAGDGSGFVVTWQDANGTNILAQLYDSNGTAAPSGNFTVNTTTAGSQAAPHVAADYSGDFVVVWEGPDTLGNVDSFMQRYDMDGVAQGGETRLHASQINSDQSAPDVALDADGDIIAVWQSDQTAANGFDVYAHRFVGPENVDLQIEDMTDSPDPVGTGIGYSYTLTINNEYVAEATGTAALDDALGQGRNVVVEATLHSGMAFTGTPAGTGWTCAEGSPGQVTCTKATLAAGDQTQLVLNVMSPAVPPANAQSEVTVSVTLTADQDDTDQTDNAASETTAVCLGSGSAGTLQFSSSDYTAADEGNPSIMVTRINGICGQTSVEYFTENDTAGAMPADANDYTAVANGTVTFANGDMAPKPAPVAVNDDNVDEAPSETFLVKLKDPPTRGALGGTTTARVTITDEDVAEVGLSVSPSNVTEGNTGGGATADVTATLTQPSDTPVKVDLTFNQPAAEQSSDYTTSGTSVEIEKGALTSTTVTVTTAPDVLNEANEDLTISVAAISNRDNAASPVHASIASDGDAVLTISNDDALPSVNIADLTVTEGDLPQSISLLVTLSAASGRDVTVNYAFADGEAVRTADYSATNGQLVIPKGVTSAVIPDVTVNADDVDEAAETFTVALTVPSGGNATVGDGSATVTINDSATDDAPLIEIDIGTNLSYLDSIDETGFGAGAGATVRARLRNAAGDANVVSGKAITVVLEFSGDFVTAPGACGLAQPPADYSCSAATITVPAGMSTASATLTSMSDTRYEGPETIYVGMHCSNAADCNEVARAPLSGSQVDVTIDDNELAPVIDFAAATSTAAEADGSVGIDVELQTATGTTEVEHDITVDYAPAGGTAAAGGDYTLAAGQLTFNAGTFATQTRTITVGLVDDAFQEVDETVVVRLSNPTRAALLAANPTDHTLTIEDDDSRPTYTISDATPLPVTEGDTGTTNVMFTIERTPSLTATTVSYATVTGTATAGSDFVAVPATQLNFPAAATTTSQQVTVQVNGDDIDEADETFTVQLSAESSGTDLGDASGDATIDDDDDATYSLGDATVTETDSGTVIATFTVTRTASVLSSSVNYATANGTATASTLLAPNGDYESASGTVSFGANETVKTFDVTVNPDDNSELDETFTATLSSPSANTSIADGTGTGTIIDDDLAYTIGDVTVTEGNSGQATATFTVTRTASSKATTISYATAGGTATPGTDYVATSGPLSFPADVSATSSTQTIQVNVTGDTLDELNETFNVDLSDASSGAIADPQGVGTITDDDAAMLSVSDASVTEGTGGTPPTLDFTVTMSTSFAGTATVQYATSNGTAMQPADYASTSGTLTFNPGGPLTQTVSVPVVSDAIDEANETLTLTLTNATGAGISDQTGAGTITDDDTATYTINDVSTPPEGNSGPPVTMVFTVTRTASQAATTVDYATANGTATATANPPLPPPGDYEPITDGTLNFAASTIDATQTISVTVNGDTVDEGDETYFINLSNASAGTIADPQGIGTITDDDAAVLSVSDAAVTEGTGSGSTSLQFTVTLSTTSASTVTVDYATANGSATQPGDYTSTGNTLTFTPGQTSKVVSVPVVRDAVDEGDETLTLELSSASGATVSDGSGTGTITDDDTATLSANDASVAEGTGAGTTTLDFVVALSTASASTVTVNYATADGTATQPGDYASTSGTLTFTPGQTSKTVQVAIVRDAIPEGNETLTLGLSGASGATVADASGTGTITEDDSAEPSVSFDTANSDPDVTEGTSPLPGNTAVIRVKLSQPDFDDDTNVSFNVSGSAAAGNDYGDLQCRSEGDGAAACGGVLTITAGDSYGEILVPTAVDATDESDETVVLTLNDPTNATLGSPSTYTLTILDDDTLTWWIDDVATPPEGNSGTVAMVFTVTRTASATATTVEYDTADGTATATANPPLPPLGDYEPASGTLNFAANSTTATQTISVTVNGDVLDEGTGETYFVDLSNESAGTVMQRRGTGTITDDDDATLSVGNATVTEGTGGGSTSLQFTVTLSTASASTVTVNYATADGTATQPADYTSTSGTLTFNPGDPLSQTVSVPVVRDAIDELNETLTLVLSGATGASIADDSGTGTITDDDAATLSVADAAVTEGTGGTAPTLDFAVTLSTASAATVTVNYATSDGTATQPADYTSTSGTLTFAAGETSKTVSVPVATDSIDEANETLTLVLSGENGATVSDPTATGTITDDDTATLSVADAVVTEGTGGTAPTLDFVVALSTASAGTVTVNYATSNGTATQPGDYASTSGTLTFNPGQPLSQTVSVSVVPDSIDEVDETVTLTLSGASGAGIADGTGTGTITDDDTATYTIDDVATPPEGNAGTATMVFTVTRTASSSATTVNYATADGTATQPGDYASASGTLNFAASATTTTQTINVMVNGDTLDEPNETYFVNLSGASAGIIGDAQGLGTITDDDASTLSVADASVTEGTGAGTTTVDFVVTLSTASASTVTVNYATADGTATQPGDYASTSGTLTFNPGGSLTQTVSVPVVRDTLDELNETLTLVLSGVNGASIADASGTGTITDDDTATLSVSDASVTEGTGGTAPTLDFVVTLSTASASTVTVNYATSNGTATQPADYASTSGSLTFTPGQSLTQTVSVPVVPDEVDEANETLALGLSGASGATIADNSGTGTITDDDTATYTIGDASAVEGNAGTVTMTFTVMRTASATSTTVDYTTANGTATATATPPLPPPGDYEPASGTLNFPASATASTLTISVTVNGDTLDEANETFFVNLSNASAGTVTDAQGIGTITDDDAAAFSVSDATVTEGTGAGSTALQFTVTLSTASASTVTVNYATVDGTATQPGDYTAMSGTLTFSPGQPLTQSVSVPVVRDAVDEANETLTVMLSGASGATIADDTGIGTITDDDTATLSVADATGAEGTGAGTTTLDFVVTLSTTAAATVTVNYATSDGTAAQPADYTSTSGTLTFASGETSKTVSVPVARDAIDEANETLTLTLSGASGAGIADATATGTITDDDTATLSVADATVTEGTGAGTTALDFVVTLSTASASTVTVNYATSNGTAAQPGDYASTSGALTFTPGQTSHTVSVPVVRDAIDEADETVTLTLSGASGATLADDTATGTIQDDDEPSFSIEDVAVTEGNSGTVTAIFTVTRTASATTATVDYTTIGVSAVEGADYADATGTLTFAASASSSTQTISVTVNGDTTDEADEIYNVNLSNASTGLIADPTGMGTITDDDAEPSLSVNNVAVTEGNAGTVNLVFTISLSAASEKTVSADYAIAGVTATSGTDYTVSPASASFSLPPGATSTTVTVTVNGDTIDESDETLQLTLSNAVNATVGTAVGTGTITDDDTATLSVSDATVTEGTGAGTTTLDFVVTLSTASAATVTVDYATANGTATQPGDYTSTGGTLTFGAGETSKTVSVPVVRDAVDEAAETLTLALSNGSGAAIVDNSATGTIANDDTPGVIVTQSGGSTAVTEGGATDTYTLVLASQPSASVTIAVNAGTQVTTNPTSVTFTTANWNVGQAVTVTAVNDVSAEGTHATTVTHAASSADAGYSGIAVGNVNVTITDNDVAGITVVESGGSTAVVEGGATDTITVRLNTQPSANVTITAAPGSQLTVTPATLTFTPANFATPRTVTVRAVDDDQVEGAHSANLGGSAASADLAYNGNLTPIAVAITDNDAVDAGEEAPGVVVTPSGNAASTSGGGGSFSWTLALGLLGLAGLRRRGSRALAAALALLAGPALAQTVTIGNPQGTASEAPAAEPAPARAATPAPARTRAKRSAGLSYNSLDLRYLLVKVDDPAVDATGYNLAGSWDVARGFYVAAGYSAIETDDFRLFGTTGSSQTDTVALGLGWHTGLNARTDVLAVVGVLSASAEGQGGFSGSADDTGFSVEAGLRGLLAPRFEWSATVGYVSIFDDSDTGLTAQTRYGFTPRFGLLAGAGVSSNSRQLSLGLRYSF